MKQTLAAVLAVVLVSVTAMVVAEESEGKFTLWGKQTAGSGHAKNAKTDGNTLVLAATATIVSVKADTDGYSIWSVVTPENRTARVILSGGKGKPDLVGKTLDKGSYRVIPGLYGKNVASVTIELE